MRLLGLCLTLVLAAGCARGHADHGRRESLPNLDQVRSRLHPARDVDDHRQATPTAKIDLRQLTLPNDAELGEAWAMTSSEGVAPSTVGACLNNGVRVGLLPVDDLAGFMTSVGGILGTQTLRFEPPTRPVPIELSRMIHRAHRLNVRPYASAGFSEDQPRGRYQFTVEVKEVVEAGVTLRMTPHLYSPQPTVTPRLPWEKQLDGRLFHELAFDVRLGRDRYVVLGRMESASPAESDGPTSGRPLGARAFATVHGGRPAQVLLLVGLAGDTDSRETQ